MMFARFVVPFLLFFGANSFLFCQISWMPFYEDETVTIYFRERSGARYGVFRSITEAPADFSKTYKVLRTIDDYSKWFGFCIESYLVAEHSPSHETAFLGIDTPWPITDKYMVPEVYFPRETDGDTAVIVYSLSEKNYGVSPPEFEPVAQLEGECVLWPIGPNKTKVVFTTCIDPGGNIPKFFIKDFLKKQLIETARGLHAFVTR